MHKVLCAILAAGVLAGCTDDDALIGFLDQEFPDMTAGVIAGGQPIGDTGRAQTFTATIERPLLRVELFLEGLPPVAPAVATIVVEIQETDVAGVPNGVVLTSREIDVAALPVGAGDWVSISGFAPPISMVNGMEYAIVVRRGQGVGDVARIGGATGDLYAGGSGWILEANGTFTAVAAEDYWFRQFVLSLLPMSSY